MKVLLASELQRLVTSACEQMGARSEDAEQVAGSLVRANLCGEDPHGVIRLAQYHEWWKKGLLDPGARPVILEERGVVAKVDGRHAFGQVAASFATRVAIDKARRDGIAVVTVRACNDVGRLGDYAETIKEAGLIGLVTANDAGAGQRVVPWGGMEPRLSTNPIAMGIPGTQGKGILFDFATSVASYGRVRKFLLAGEKTPSCWLVDATGTMTCDPEYLFTDPRGGLLPAGGHKGYALSLAVEVLSGILSGAGFANLHPGPEEMNGVFILALDVTWFMPLDEFCAQVDELTAYIKTARPAPGVGRVYIPGERSREEAVRLSREGIALDEETWSKMEKTLEDLGDCPKLSRQ